MARRTRGGRTWTIVAGSLAFATLIVPIAVAAGGHLPGARSDPLVDTRDRRSGLEVLSPIVDIQARLAQPQRGAVPSQGHRTGVSAAHLALRLRRDAWTSTGSFRDAGGTPTARPLGRGSTTSSRSHARRPMGTHRLRAATARLAQPFLFDPDLGTLL